MEKVKNMDKGWKVRFPTKNIYVMRDHNWAFSAWEIGRLNKEIKSGAKLLHVDFHDDYLAPSSEKNISDIHSKEKALQVGAELDIFDFIIPAEETGTVKEVYMIGDFEKPSNEVYHAYTYNHFMDEHRKEFVKDDEHHSYILDLDLDFFNLHAYKNISNNWGSNPYLYSEEFIRNQLNKLKNNLVEWDLITVSISPEHCGGNEPAQELFDIFLDVFELKDEEFVNWG
ncbi:UPF0489 family protein [Peribacillus sp. V2I11]|uniref:UPF0489 family protein n=1 Tax=Peribacillus sp. V2I11 TaxID=3042277 RepID=UPI002787A5F7|nr:UPF0489 family protein [Peribacillus sp. V2I11]MDQ0884762.1 putative transport protein [Peribacillus sp. V2I11]